MAQKNLIGFLKHVDVLIGTGTIEEFLTLKNQNRIPDQPGEYVGHATIYIPS